MNSKQPDMPVETCGNILQLGNRGGYHQLLKRQAQQTENHIVQSILV